MDFKPFPKLARLNRGMVISEKIDGTNSAIVVKPAVEVPDGAPESVVAVGDLHIWAQSRKRLIYPGKSRDNYGFAGWVKDHAEELAQLGPGYHYGEWWGNGIQRGYGLKEKRFSLFNVSRWEDKPRPACCSLVPVIKRANFNSEIIEASVDWLRENGSLAAPGYMNPEGVVVYLSAARTSFKVTLKNDGVPKSQVAA